MSNRVMQNGWVALRRFKFQQYFFFLFFLKLYFPVKNSETLIKPHPHLFYPHQACICSEYAENSRASKIILGDPLRGPCSCEISEKSEISELLQVW